MPAPMIARHRTILDLARRRGRVTVDELSGLLTVTPQTIRKDLNDLCAKNFLSRVHGGAVANSRIENPSYESHRTIADAEMQAIGRAAEALIPDGASLIINIGTTPEAVARALVNRRDLLVVTNNLNVVDILSDNLNIEVIVAGGPVRQSDRAVVGAAAVDFISQFKVDFAIIGASAIDEDGSLLGFDLSDVHMSQAIVRNARSVILVADHEKFERSAPVRIGHVSEVDFFVTDRLESSTIRAVCGAHSVRVVEATSESERPGRETSAALGSADRLTA